MAKTKENKKEKLVKEVALEVLNLLGVEDVKVSLKKSKEDILNINIESKDSGVLIGRQGETLANLQLILSLIAYKKLGEWQRIVLDVGDWREQRQESLKRLAQNTAQKVKLSGESVVLTRLNPSERRIVHMELSGSSDVATESQGEGGQRVLMVKPKNKNDKE
jgi:spoIIIJ-associated protein